MQRLLGLLSEISQWWTGTSPVMIPGTIITRTHLCSVFFLFLKRQMQPCTPKHSDSFYWSSCLSRFTLCPSKWGMSISNPFKASTKVMVTFVYKSSPFLLKLSCLLRQKKKVCSSILTWAVLTWDRFYITIIKFCWSVQKICGFLALLMIQSPDEMHCTTRLKRPWTMSTTQNDKR